MATHSRKPGRTEILTPAANFKSLASSAALLELALLRGEGQLTESGAFVANTGKITGRSPKDRYLVPEPDRGSEIGWGAVNRLLEARYFDRLLERVRGYLSQREVFTATAVAGADPRYQLPVRVFADRAWHALFAQSLFRREPPSSSSVLAEPLNILVASGVQADPETDGTRSGVFIVLNLERRIVLIGGTEYAGEIKKSVFSVLNYLLPFHGVFPMHCSANLGPGGDTALFFGLSGTGKTTLSADPDRRLIGDDEHGWSDQGVFNLEGGCYAKCIRLSREREPQIWDAIRFGSVLENVVVDPATRQPDFDDASLTENTRAAYPLEFIPGAEPTSRGGHPRQIVFLTCDAFGVLPPVARLTPEQALYHFLSGYTAKIAGTETGVTEPEATFSTCFAAPFLPLPPARYAELLHDRLRTHHSQVWLLNTGWTGGAHGVGRRIALHHTRAMARALLAGQLDDAPCHVDPIFGIAVPRSVANVPELVLQPRSTWADPTAYDNQARRLAALFQKNFEQYAAQVTPAVREAGPRIP